MPLPGGGTRPGGGGSLSPFAGGIGGMPGGIGWPCGGGAIPAGGTPGVGGEPAPGSGGAPCAGGATAGDGGGGDATFSLALTEGAGGATGAGGDGGDGGGAGGILPGDGAVAGAVNLSVRLALRTCRTLSPQRCTAQGHDADYNDKRGKHAFTIFTN